VVDVQGRQRQLCESETIALSEMRQQMVCGKMKNRQGAPALLFY
jgi:hypothetical protein